MTGPEHYREAERDLKTAHEVSLRDGTAAFYLASAQVHATLALSAAMIDGLLEKVGLSVTGEPSDWAKAVGS